MTLQAPAVSAEAIDGSFVPVAADSVASVTVDGEVVLLDGSTGILRNLDPIGGVVWGCLGAPGTIDEIVSDLCAEFGADATTVRDDVIGLMRTLGREGLLAGVASERHGDGHNGPDHPIASRAGESVAPEPEFLEEPPSS